MRWWFDPVTFRQGPECRQITEELIKNLGDVIHTENTAEYFEEKVINKNIERVRHSWMANHEMRSRQNVLEKPSSLDHHAIESAPVISHQQRTSYS